MSSLSSDGRRNVRNFLSFWLPVLLLVIGAFWLSAKFVEPAPPKHTVIITGREDGEYFAIAKKFAKVFAANGIELTVRPSAGSVENYQQLLKPDGDVDLAIVQGGTLPPADQVEGKIEGIASLYLEPLCVFYRDPKELTRLSELAGKKIAIGEPGSGTQALATLLLPACGVYLKSTLPLNGPDAAKALSAGEIDAVMIVAAPQSSIVHDLLSAPGVKLMSFSQAVAMSRKFQFLSATTLYKGSVDLAKNLPADNVQLIAPAAMLVARGSAHKSLVLLGTMAAVERQKVGTLLSEPGQFPSSRYLEVPIAKEADHYLTHGPSIMQRVLPFWLASFLDRIVIMLLPLAALLIPLVRFTPPLYVWRTRARIYRWYKEIRAIDEKMGPTASPDVLSSHLQQIKRIEDEVRSVHVPLSYMEELYHLRVHLRLLEEKAKEAVAGEK